MSNEKPILFKDEMIRAILEGRKTQTRRIMKVQPPTEKHQLLSIMDSTDRKQVGRSHWAILNAAKTSVIESDKRYFSCPFGKPGDRLWVREKFATHFIWDGLPPGHIDIQNHSDGFFYADGTITSPGCEDHQRGKWRSSIHMPRWASRITLEITGVRVERLQDISDEDAKAEGCWYGKGGGVPDPAVCPGDHFPTLWQSINGTESWEANPWVWVIEFKHIDQEEKAA